MKSDSCIIIGNGPSLKNVPNSILESMPTFGSNGILLKFEPSYYVAVNPLAIKRFAPRIKNSLKAHLFLAPNTLDVRYVPLYSMPTPLFSYDPLNWVYEGYTVTFVCMQLAFYFGFTRVYLLGVDHHYIFSGPPNEENKWEGDDPNHFDPDYFKNAFWNNPDLAQSERSYALARKAFENDGRSIINCTSNSLLTVFEKGSLPP